MASYQDSIAQNLATPIGLPIVNVRPSSGQPGPMHETTAPRAARLQALALHLALTHQRRGRRLAVLLHEHVQQLLAAARMKLGSLRMRIEDQRFSKAIEEVEGLLGLSLAETRSVTLELSPPVLYDGGLVAGLEWLARRAQEQHGLNVELDVQPGAEPADDDLRALLFHAVAELLANVVQHGHTDQAYVVMKEVGSGQIAIDVVDRGRGFDPASLEGGGTLSGMGLLAIREQLELLGGRLTIRSAPGQGTKASIVAPRQWALDHPPYTSMPGKIG